MKIINKPLLDMEGNPLMAGDIKLTTAKVLMNVALAQLPVDPGKGEKPPANTEQMDLYLLAVQLNGVAENESFELSIEQIDTLGKKMPYLYTPLIAGQVRAMIEGKH